MSAAIHNSVGYPFNLIDAIFCEEFVWVDDEDHMNGLNHALGTLSEREQKVLAKRFQEVKTLEEVGNDFGVTRERIRQMEAKALRKLRHMSRQNFILHGYIGGAELKELKAREEQLDEREKEIEKREKALQDILVRYKPKFDALKINIDMPLEMIQKNIERSAGIETMDLSVRSYNCLKRLGVNTIMDLILLVEGNDYWDLAKARNLGRKSLREIIEKLDAMTGNNYSDKYYL
jgi:hypothetical protein